jgi:site-specific DNA-cytosine methylase
MQAFGRFPAMVARGPARAGPACLQRARESFGGYTDVYSRLAWSEPGPTITARCRTPSCGRFVHPEQDRGLTAREAALLQTFPRDTYGICVVLTVESAGRHRTAMRRD